MNLPEQTPIPTAPTIRPYAVCNGHGEHLRAFAQWEIAHAWAHTQADDPATILPIEIEDRAQRVTTRITHDTCELITWTVFTKDPCCAPRSTRVPPYLTHPPAHPTPDTNPPVTHTGPIMTNRPR